MGATMPNLNAGIVERMPVPIPPLRIQDSLIAVLEAFDELIENNRRRVEVLEEMARTIYREWFVKFRYPGHEDVPLVDSVLGPIPVGWVACPVSELSAAVTRGIAPKYAEDGEWIVLNQKCIRDERVSFGPSHRQERKVSDVKHLRYGDVLINSTGVGTLGRVALYRGPSEGVTVDSHVTIVRPSDGSLNPWYGLSLVAKKPDFERLGTGSTGQTELGRGDIGAEILAVPPTEVLSRFADALWPLLAEADALLAAADSTAQLRDLLLPKLVTGQIDVSTLDLGALVGDRVA